MYIKIYCSPKGTNFVYRWDDHQKVEFRTSVLSKYDIEAIEYFLLSADALMHHIFAYHVPDCSLSQNAAASVKS